MSIERRMKREEKEVRDRKVKDGEMGCGVGRIGGNVNEWRVVVWSLWLS